MDDLIVENVKRGVVDVAKSEVSRHVLAFRSSPSLSLFAGGMVFRSCA